MVFGSRRLAAAAGLGLALLGCSPSQEPGALMLAISTDMFVPTDLQRIDVVVEAEDELAPYRVEFNLAPLVGGEFLPGTFAINEGESPGKRVHIRVIARGEQDARVVREASLNVPRGRTATLNMPIQWLCDGEVRVDGQLHRSDCPDGETCKLGSCVVDEVEEESLPDFVEAEVFGGGTADGGGECFHTVPCLEGGQNAAVDMVDCVLRDQDASNLNVAVVLPPGASGHCSETECLVPLDNSELSGWWSERGDVHLPAAVCQRVAELGAAVRVSNDCASKTPSTPTCGLWTKVGTVPGSPSDTENIETPFVPNEGEVEPVEPAKVVGGVEQAARAITDAVGAACAELARVSPPSAELSGEDVAALCDAAGEALMGAGAFSWFPAPTRCWPNADEQLACEQACGGNGCSPTTLEQRCEQLALSGQCAGTCGARVCASPASGDPVACDGNCIGRCTGTCDGNCLGKCLEGCEASTAGGDCDARCAGQCEGLCEGRCQGQCVGHCDPDPLLSDISCGDAVCLGGCTVPVQDAVCEGPLGTSTCNLDVQCAQDCITVSHVGVMCDPPRAWVVGGGWSDEERARVEGALAELVLVRDMKAPLVMGESGFVIERWSARRDIANSAELLSKLSVAQQQLSTVQASLDELLSSAGSARGFAGAYDPIGPADCSVVVASGQDGLIDDFEDGDEWLRVADGRNGNWYLVHDGTGQLQQSAPPQPESGAPGGGYAMHVQGSGFSEWGAALGVDLRDQGALYDPRPSYSGLRFWAAGQGRLRVIFMQGDLDPAHPCGSCDPQATQCGGFYSQEVQLVAAGVTHDISFEQLQAQGGPVPLSTELISIQFEAPPPDDIDFWLDDVRFY